MTELEVRLEAFLGAFATFFFGFAGKNGEKGYYFPIFPFGQELGHQGKACSGTGPGAATNTARAGFHRKLISDRCYWGSPVDIQLGA